MSRRHAAQISIYSQFEERSGETRWVAELPGLAWFETARPLLPPGSAGFILSSEMSEIRETHLDLPRECDHIVERALCLPIFRPGEKR